MLSSKQNKTKQDKSTDNFPFRVKPATFWRQERTILSFYSSMSNSSFGCVLMSLRIFLFQGFYIMFFSANPH